MVLRGETHWTVLRTIHRLVTVGALDPGKQVDALDAERH